MKELVQKKRRDFRKYTLDADGLKAEISIRGNYQLFNFKYEDIGFNESIIRKSPSLTNVLLLVSLILNIFFLIAFFALVLPAGAVNMVILIISGLVTVALSIFLGKYLLGSGIEKIIEGDAKISFNYEKKEGQKVDAFINALKNKQREYMRRKYMRIDHLIPADHQIKVFLWLYNLKFITRSEYELLLEETEKLKSV